MYTGLHNNQGFAEETIDESRTDPAISRPEPRDAHNVSDSSIMQVVLDLCEENTRNTSPSLQFSELPSFAEQGFEVHQVDLAPQLSAQVLREQRLRSAGDWAALAQLLIERAEITGDAAEAATLLVEAAMLYGEQLESFAGAHAILAKALEIDPTHADAADQLESMAQCSGDWIDVVQSFSESAAYLEHKDPTRAGELRIRLACAQAHGLRDISGAFSTLSAVRVARVPLVGAYLDVLERMIRGLGQLESMIGASHRIGDCDRTARLMSRAIAMSQSVIERAAYHHRIGQIEINRDEDDAAIWHWSEAVRLDPNRNDVRDALAGLYEERGEFRRAVELLEEARACSTNAEHRAQYACDAARIYSDALGENTRAVDLFAAALQVQPGHQAASMPVVERYYTQKRWNELESVLSPLLQSDYAESLPADERCELYLKAGTCSEALGRHEQALLHFRSILEVEPDRLEALEGSAKCLLELRDYSEAISEAQRAIAVQGIGPDDSESIAMLSLSASAHRSLGQQELAIELFERCAHHDHKASMQALAELLTLQGEHRKAVAMQVRVVDVTPKTERVELLCQIADTLASELGDIEAAIDLCWQALSLKRDSRAALHRLAVLYAKNEEWREAIKTIVRMAGLETGALRRARYLQAAGAMAMQHEQEEEAVALLNRAIESYMADTVMSSTGEVRASCFSCFEDIIAMLSSAADWRGVERNYRKMICRLEPGDPDVGRLWTALGHVYREKLGETTAAIDSFEVASTLQQGSLTNHRILVDLYEGAGPDQLDKAIARRRVLLEAEPDHAEHFKALRGLYVRTRQMDRAWCVCRALESMGAAEDREIAFYRRNMSLEMQWPSRPLNSEMWSRFRDDRVDPNISRIFGLVGEVIAQQCTQPSGQGAMREHVGAHFDHLRQLFSASSYAFGLPTFDCAIDSERQRPVSLLNLRRDGRLRPTFVLGEALYRGRSVQQIASGLGRSLALGRRSYYLRLALPDPAELAAAFYAGLSLVQPAAAVPQSLSVRVDLYRASLAKNLHPTWTRKLHEAASAFLQGGARFDLQAWCDGADATARHAALLLSGDLQFGLSEIRDEEGLSVNGVEAARRALRLASISEPHMSLREELGLAIVEA